MQANRAIKSIVIRVLVLAMLLSVLLLLSVQGALADPGSKGTTAASCVGVESAGISPPGSSDEFVGGIPGLHSFLRESFPDSSLGSLVSPFAKLHLQTHEGCDAAG
jgi:hypothetical protein